MTTEKIAMKKTTKRALAIFALLAILCSFVSCKKIGSTATITNAEELHEATKGGDIEVTNYSVSKYKGVKKNLEIQNDFTISTDDEFFTAMVANFKLNEYVPGRMMQDCTINGNGHTITITGSDGSLGKYSVGLFARLMNCNVKDLNIVYDLEVNIAASGKSVGGLCGVAENSTFANCTVTYNKPASFSGYRAGGLVGLFSGSMTDCDVVGDFKVTTVEHFGGIAGGLDNATAKNCTVNGSIVANDLHKAEIGGLFGWMQGEVSSSKATLSCFSVAGKTDKWTAYDAYCGALVGKIYGNLHDCVLELSENSTVSATEHSSGMFRTNMHTGLVTGWAAKDSKIDNIFIDAMDGHKVNIIFPDNSQTVALGIYKNESSSVGKIYYAEDEFIHQHIERVREYTTENVPNDNDILYTFKLRGMPASVTVCREEPMEHSYQTVGLILKIGGDEYALTTKIDDTPLKPSFKTTEDGFVYEVTVVTEGAFIDVSKTLAGCSTDGVTFVCDYAEVIFEGNAFTTDSDGKPVLK